MKNIKLILCLLGISTSLSVYSLERLSDSSLSGVQGQAGLTIEQSQLLNIGNLSYTDDSNTLSIEGFRISSQADTNAAANRTYTLDVLADGSLKMKTEIEPTQLHIDGIRINNSPASFGDLTLNYEAITDFSIKGMSTGSLEGSFTTGISNAEMIWRTNGNAMSFDNIGYNASIDNFTLEYDATDNTKDFLRTGLALGMNNFAFDFSTGALRLGGKSLGELSGNLALSANTQIFAGGRSKKNEAKEGLTFHSQVNILQDEENKIIFTDYDADGTANSLLMGDFSGALNIDNLTFDVEVDHLAIGFDEVVGSFRAGRILIGDSLKPVGSIELDFMLKDDVANSRYNRLQLYPGIRQPDFDIMPVEIEGYARTFYSGLDSTSEGLSMMTQWNLANAELSYIDDGNRVIISGIESHGSANTTIDIRGQNKLAIGVSDLIGSYSIDGLKVGDNPDAPIQGGAELLLSLEVFQAMDFDIDGFTEITAGGHDSFGDGGGITINGDYFFTNTNIGLSIDENGEGIWATGVSYDIHLRDITFDVASNFYENDRLVAGGLKINRGEQWSTMDIDNLRWGNKVSGRSLGRVVLERFEKNSSLAIIPGGAGAVCIGGSLNSTGDGCSGSNGRFEDRGEQGMTVSLKAALADAEYDAGGEMLRGNRLTWENNRTARPDGEIKGTQIIFDDYSTNDGAGNSDNNYGLQANLNIDVYETKVLKKSDGTDAGGVNGSFGEELIYDQIGTDVDGNPIRGNEYTYIDSAIVEADTPVGAELRARRPLGFAVQGNVSFKELNIGAVQLKHPDIATPETVFYGVVMQNLNLTTNLTATPIQ